MSHQSQASTATSGAFSYRAHIYSQYDIKLEPVSQTEERARRIAKPRSSRQLSEAIRMIDGNQRSNSRLGMTLTPETPFRSNSRLEEVQTLETESRSSSRLEQTPTPDVSPRAGLIRKQSVLVQPSPEDIIVPPKALIFKLRSKMRPRQKQATNSDSTAQHDPQANKKVSTEPIQQNNKPSEKPLQATADIEKASAPEPPPNRPSGAPSDYLSTQTSRPRSIAFLFIISMLQLLPQAALTTCFPTSSLIASWFHITHPSILPWMIAAYATTFGSFILISGRLGDIFGHKKLVFVGFVLMTPWSIIAGVSHMISPVLFFVARAMQGIAASMMVPNGLALLGRTYPPGSKMKIIAFSIFGLCAPLGMYLGMLFGAIFAEHLAWWVSFYVLGGVSFICAVSSRLVILAPPPTEAQMRPFKQKLGDMDWLGAVTGVAGLICVQVALVSAPSAGWDTQWIFMLLIIGILLVAAFVVVEVKIAQRPLVPFNLLNSDVAFVLAVVACGWAVFGIWSWYLWRYLLTIRHFTPLSSAIHILPIIPIAILASILTAYLMRTTRPAWTLLYALIAATLGPLFLLFASPNQTYWSFTFVSLLVMPVFMDFCLPSATYIMSNFFPMHMQGVSGSLVATVMNYSISLGLGLATTVSAYTSHPGEPAWDEMRGAWVMGVGIGAVGVLICFVYLVKSVFLHHGSPRPLTIRDLDIAAENGDQAPYDESHTTRNVIPIPPIPISPPRTLFRVPSRSSLAASFGLGRANSTATSRFGRKKQRSSLWPQRRGSDASQQSSLFPLTRQSSHQQGDDEWRDRMMPRFEWRQVPVEGPRTGSAMSGREGVGVGGARYDGKQIQMSQRERYAANLNQGAASRAS